MKFWRSPGFWATFVGSCLLSGCVNNAPVVVSSPNAQSAPNEKAQPVATAGSFTVGLILVGPKNDGGWSEVHYNAMQYVIERLPNVRMDYIDRVNPGDRANMTAVDAAEELIKRGAKMLIFNSDDMKDEALKIAQKHPQVSVLHLTGDYAWKQGKNFKNQPNLANLMLQMEYGRMLAGCSAALTTKTGKIGFLGPLINDETRRLVSSAYLGARHCWQTYRKRDPADLKFKVTWIGFWFNIPGKTLDPLDVANDFYNNGFDVVMTGIDTPEAALQAMSAQKAGKEVRFLHYTLPTGCNFAPHLCLGVPYYNWGPSFLSKVKQAQAGQFVGDFLWVAPDWQNINNLDTSAIGFVRGNALTPDNQKFLDDFISKLGNNSLNLYRGPLLFQDGTPFVRAGQEATLQQIWYMPQLLQGIEGASTNPAAPKSASPSPSPAVSPIASPPESPSPSPTAK